MTQQTKQVGVFCYQAQSFTGSASVVSLKCPNSGSEAAFCTLHNIIVPVSAFHLCPGISNTASHGEFYFTQSPLLLLLYLLNEMDYVILNGQT